ncbi:MAG: type 1 glutamine amidotransferase [Albidovulum sp.]|nr:type 1 glutamine amidotransferase [Albidovulum sp.]
MIIGILQTGHVIEELSKEFGDYDGMFRRLLSGRGFQFRTWNVVDCNFPDSLRDAEGWLITGSRFAVYEDHPWIEPLATFIRECYRESSPIAGICFGHQILAHALGGKVEKFAGGWTVGLTEYEFNGHRIKLNAWHQDQVVELPNEAETIGSSRSCKHAIVAYGEKAFSVQPHPEFDREFLAQLIDKRGRGIVPEYLLREAIDNLDNPSDSARIASAIAEFFLLPSERIARPAQGENV